MQNVKLKYKPEAVNGTHKYFKYMGLFWLIMVVIQIITENTLNELGWYSIIFGISHVIALNIESHVFATIKNGMFKKNRWFASQTDLTKAKYVKKFAGDVSFVFNNKEIRIEAMFLDETSQDDLDNFIASYEIPTKVIPVQ
ncbi:hypothetical protein [Psychroflexus planctonicus]|uniref:Uncharacterized protein n=1 Tax=Psychroflexus planctonicus TaxID=1526575 RepID=A0ABQ1SIR5_9FLAO|nr:hypothetical protein [Psychroflexus planctonicus]GGE38907.1 hypothetical protein GCM10010832_18970 [Psychroflexus planctonicus]